MSYYIISQTTDVRHLTFCRTLLSHALKCHKRCVVNTSSFAVTRSMCRPSDINDHEASSRDIKRRRKINSRVETQNGMVSTKKKMPIGCHTQKPVTSHSTASAQTPALFYWFTMKRIVIYSKLKPNFSDYTIAIYYQARRQESQKHKKCILLNKITFYYVTQDRRVSRPRHNFERKRTYIYSSTRAVKI